MDIYSYNSAIDNKAVCTIVNIIHQLRDTYGMPVNFIQSSEPAEIHWSTPRKDIAASLDAILAQTKNYRWRMIAGRYVLYPNDPVWDINISGIAITDLPRLDAATQYVIAIQTQVPALQDLIEPPIKGDWNAPVYTKPVSLHPEASIMEHLIELLGTDEQLVFTIERTLSNRRMIHFQHIMTGPSKDE